MAWNTDSLQALINNKYMPVLFDNIFQKSHPLLAMLKKKAKTYNGREIAIPLEYAEGGSVVWGDQHALGTDDAGANTPAVSDPFKQATYSPSMLTGLLLFTKEEQLVANSDEAVKNVITAKIKNLQKTIEKNVATNLWGQADVSGAWNRLGLLLQPATSTAHTVGGIEVDTSPATNLWWQTPVHDANVTTETPSDLAYAPEIELEDSTKANYIGKLLSIGVAKARAQTGENPDIIMVSQYIFDLIEQVLDPRKTGSKMNQMMGAMGFTAIDYRGIPIVADQDLGNVGGLASPVEDFSNMYFLNTKYLYMFFNSGAKFKAGGLIEDTRSNTFVQKVHAFGNMVVSNRGAHSIVQNVYTPNDYQ